MFFDMRVSVVPKCLKKTLNDAKYGLHFLLIFSCSGIILCSQEVIMTSENGFRGVKALNWHYLWKGTEDCM